MSTLPDCDTLYGYLPVGIHHATHDEIRQRFVLPDVRAVDWGSPQRHTLFSGYERLVAALELTGIPAEQWIGGSFVSRHHEPADIDLVNFCDVLAFEGLAPELRAMIRQYFLGDKTAAHCHCDSYFVPAPPENPALSADFEIVRAYWKKKLGHDKIGRPKGIISRRVETEPETLDNEEQIDAAAT